MKRLGRILGSFCCDGLTVASLQAVRANPIGRRDFNHMTRLPAFRRHRHGGCEKLPRRGVFKVRPEIATVACARKRVLGRKSNAHIVTNASVRNLHFNTTHLPGGAITTLRLCLGMHDCHNGRLSMNKPSTHNAGNRRPNPAIAATGLFMVARELEPHRSGGCLLSCHISSPEVSAPNPTGKSRLR